VPIQRASFVERARSWAAGRSQSDFDPAPRHPESPVASRSAERPSASQTFERRVPERQIPQTGSRTPDLPGFRPPTLQREEETSRPGVQAHQPTLSGDATPTLQRPSEGSVPGPNIQEPPAAAATPEALPTPAPRDYSEIRRLVGQDPAPTTLRSEPESPRPSIQMSSAPAPAPPASFETVAGPSPAAPARATALPENRTIEFRQTGFPGPQVQTLGTPPAQFLPPTAQLPLVGEHLPAGLGGRPGSFPAPAGDQISTAPIQRSRTPAMGSAGPLPPAAANRTQNASPEPSPTAARDAFAAPYLPEAPSAPAVHAAPPQVQRAAGGQPSRDLYAAAAESAAAAAVAAGVASRGPDGALVFRSPEAAAPPVPTAPAPPPVPVPAPVPVQRVTATAPAKEAEQAEPEPPDLDELAMRLYPKLRPYLRKDLWLDRERSGLLADLR
jgi:hypothetical protein